MRARPAKPADIPQMTAILNHYILNTVITFRLEPISESDMEKTYNYVCSQNLPFIVVTEPENDETVLSFTYATGYRMPNYAGYSHTAEITVLAHPDHKYKGIGTIMMSKLLDILKNLNQHPEYVSPLPSDGSGIPRITEVIAVMAIDPDGRDGGYGLRDFYARWGMKEVGHLHRVGYKQGKWLDTLFLQLSLHSE